MILIPGKIHYKALIMKNYLFVFVLLFFWSHSLKSQVECGTEISQAQSVLESTLNIAPVKANESLPLLDMELSVTVYIVKDNKGTTGVTTSQVYSAVDRLNAAFSPIKLKFRICAINYIANYQYDSLSLENSLPDLLIQHHTTNTINLYLVSKIMDKNNSEVTGLSFMPGDRKDAVILRKKLIQGNEIIHQFGHFFNLYHTSETKFGKELADDPDCSKTGDRCCDTPADPGIRDFIGEGCEYTGSGKDDGNKFYVPSMTNYMSVGNESCRCCFTHDQYQRMVNAVQIQKKNLW
jgi:hypothetical protein